MRTRPKLRPIDRRTSRITATFTRVEAATVRASAKIKGLTASEYVRRLALKAN